MADWDSGKKSKNTDYLDSAVDKGYPNDMGATRFSKKLWLHENSVRLIRAGILDASNVYPMPIRGQD